MRPCQPSCAAGRPPIGGDFGFAADPDLAAGETAISWLPERAPAAVALVAATSTLCASSTLPPPLDIVGRADDGHRRWIGLGDGMTLVARPDFDPEAPFGVLVPLDSDWSTRRGAAVRLQRRLLGERRPPALPPQARTRFAAALRVFDARTAGASYREIAAVLYGEARVAAETWPTSPLKAQTARLTNHGHSLVEHGYRHLLSGHLGRRPLLDAR